jgi:hypothetical protein
MTHDELLAKINDFESIVHPIIWSKSPYAHWRNALLAVVELHKPIEEDGKLWCEHEVCYNHIEFLERNDCDCFYPCPTIQRIEKELA